MWITQTDFRISAWNKHHSLTFLKCFLLIPNNPPPHIMRNVFSVDLCNSQGSYFLSQKLRNWRICWKITSLTLVSRISSLFSGLFSGFSGMALANCMGSIVFDILFCLGLPWLLMVATNGGHDVILNDNLVLVIVCLLGSGVFIILCYVFSGFTLNKISSVIFILAYIGFLAVAVFTSAESGTVEGC